MTCFSSTALKLRGNTAAPYLPNARETVKLAIYQFTQKQTNPTPASGVSPPFLVTTRTRTRARKHTRVPRYTETARADEVTKHAGSVSVSRWACCLSWCRPLSGARSHKQLSLRPPPLIKHLRGVSLALIWGSRTVLCPTNNSVRLLLVVSSAVKASVLVENAFGF